MRIWKKVKTLFGSSGHDQVTLDRDLDRLQAIIGYHFHDVELLILSLTHRSYCHANGTDTSNERLEFLGDSVLGLVIADQLFRDHPDMREGRLTKTKAKLVNEATLADVAQQIGLNRFLLLSPEEDRAGGRERASIVSDAFESIIGAAYLDGGFDAARDIVFRLIYSRKGSILADRSHRNFKGRLLEFAQARGDGMPRYEVISETGPDHEKKFEVVVLINGEEAGSGAGTSKKEAEQQAAESALNSLMPPSQ